MTPSAARAAVEALANDCRRHTQSTEGGVCQECVVAFAAAQRAEEREACIGVIRDKGMEWHNALPDDRPTLVGGLNSIVTVLRARREGPG